MSSNPSVKKRKKLQGDTRRKIEVKILRETKGGEIDRFEKRETEREKETGIQRENNVKCANLSFAVTKTAFLALLK